MRSTFGIIFSVILFSRSFAQVTYVPDTSIQVFAYGNRQTLAWCGGFNSSQVTMGDLNHDGVQDMVLFQPWVGVTTFINRGTAGHPDYHFAPEYEANFPPVYDYLVLADYNCDGIPDLFQQGTTGFAVYTGYYNTSNQLCFSFYKNLYYEDSLMLGGTTNAFVQPGSIPAIVDVDNDGDLDFLSYNIAGGYINFYKNMRVEMGLPCDSIVIQLASSRWGDAYVNPYGPQSPCLFNYDMDSDYDMLTQSKYSDNMALFLNGRIPYNRTGPDSMISEDTTWQSGGKVIHIPEFPTAFNVDVDQDGRKDLVISSLSGNENYNCFWYYKNLNTIPGTPDWQFQSDSFLTSQSIDLGSSAYPMFFDYNKDGLPDLFIGSDGYYQDSNGALLSRISYYQNTSASGNASFTLQTKDFIDLGTQSFNGAAPAFGDIDNDGKADMIIGHTDGTLSYYKNMAASDAVTPDWQLEALVVTDVNGDTINVGGYAAPFIYDIDKDGKKDLLIGNFNGTIQYYQNVTTTPGTMSLKLVTTQLGGVKVDARTNVSIFSAPFIGKIDSTGVDYLVVGANSGNIYVYTGFQSGDTTATYTLLDSQFAYIDSTYNFYNHAGTSAGIYGNMRTTVTFADVANTGSINLVVGNIKGGVTTYKQNNSYLAVPVVSTKNVTVYPNPATDQLNIEQATGSGYQICNVLGQVVMNGRVTSDTYPVNIATLIKGAYLLVITGNNGFRSTQTIIKY